DSAHTSCPSTADRPETVAPRDPANPTSSCAACPAPVQGALRHSPPGWIRSGGAARPCRVPVLSAQPQRSPVEGDRLLDLVVPIVQCVRAGGSCTPHSHGFSGSPRGLGCGEQLVP